MKELCSIFIALGLSLVALAQQTPTEKIEFASFQLEIGNFISETHQNTRSGQAIIADTAFISENPCDGDGHYIAGKTLRISPKVKGDRYEVFYSLHAQIRPEFDPETEQTNLENGEHKPLHFQTENLPVRQLDLDRFMLPEAVNVDKYLPVIREKFAFRDTSVTVPGEVYQHHFIFSKGGKLYELQWDTLHLTIQITTEKKRKIRQYVVVYLTEGCD